MQVPQRKNKKTNKNLMYALFLLMILILVLATFALQWAKKQEQKPYRQEQGGDTTVNIMQATPDEIASIAVDLKGHEGYTLFNHGGGFSLLGHQGTLDPYMAAAALDCFAPLYMEEALTADQGEYVPYLSNFGLAEPVLSLKMTHIDGEELILTIGDKEPDTERRYMILSNDPHLYLGPDILYESFYFDYRLFFEVVQPQLSASRIDSISIQNNLSDQGFAFERTISDKESISDDLRAIQNSFYLTLPVSYPVNSEWMTPILTALNNFVLGPRQAPDTPENRGQYGLAKPEYVLSIHQKAGPESVTDEMGQVSRMQMPEVTYVFELGSKSGDITRHVAVNGWIYAYNSFQLSFVYDIDPMTVLSRHPLNMPLELVKQIENGQDIYLLSHTAHLYENGDVQKDEQGNILYDTTVSKNGEVYDISAFQDLYESLGKISISGRLPDGFTPENEIVRTIRFILTNGQVRQITLMDFDAMHSAVGVDGVYLFYIIKGGLDF